MKLYEGMFVTDHNAAKENFQKVEAAVQECITRFGGEIVNSIKWDERRLAYEIRKHKRGTFILMHFKAPGESIVKIERQLKLTEHVLRALILVDEDGPVAEAFTGRDDISFGDDMFGGPGGGDRRRDRGDRGERRERGPRQEAGAGA